jgi:DNA-directed RNA polymerase sigma subunit (sigma70/sigma32)
MARIDPWRELIQRHPRTTLDEELALAPLARDGDRSAVDRLVLGNLGVAAKLARLSARRFEQLGFDDLMAEGVWGLQKATLRYDPLQSDPPKRFGGYARFWVVREQQALCARMSRIASVPRHVRDAQRGDVASVQVTAISINQEFRSSKKPSSASLRLVDALPATEAAVESEAVAALGHALRARIDALLPEERACVVAVFGLSGELPVSIAAAARALGFSPRAVRAMLASAISCMRHDTAVRASWHAVRDESGALDQLSLVLPCEVRAVRQDPAIALLA